MFLKQDPLLPDEEFVSHDVESLFTNVPVHETIYYILQVIYAEEKLPNISSKLIIKRLQGGPQKCPYFSLAITFTKKRKPTKFFLHRDWKFIEFFWCKPL